MNIVGRKWWAIRRNLNKALVQFQNNFIRNSRVIGYPFQLTLEPGNVCNLRCPLCPTTHREERLPKGMLSLENAKSIIDRFPYAVQMVLSNWGEPFLNKDIFEIIAYAKARDINVRLESNFVLFDREKAVRLLDSGLDTLAVALDGNSQATYERYRVGGRFDRVIENLETLLDVKREKKNSGLEVEWKFVVNRYNEHEVDAARARAGKMGIPFHLVTIWAPEHGEEWLPENPKFLDAGGREAPDKCHHLWQAVTVNFNGDLFSCCSEFAPVDRLVNVIEQPFESIWNGEDYRSRREINKGPVNCERCHRDKNTKWYQTWMANSNAPKGPSADAKGDAPFGPSLIDEGR